MFWIRLGSMRSLCRNTLLKSTTPSLQDPNQSCIKWQRSPVSFTMRSILLRMTNIELSLYKSRRMFTEFGILVFFKLKKNVLLISNRIMNVVLNGHSSRSHYHNADAHPDSVLVTTFFLIFINVILDGFATRNLCW